MYPVVPFSLSESFSLSLSLSLVWQTVFGSKAPHLALVACFKCARSTCEPPPHVACAPAKPGGSSSRNMSGGESLEPMSSTSAPVLESSIHLSPQELTDWATTFSQDELHLLRGTSLSNILHKGGVVLQNNVGHASTYDLSKPVISLDTFLSHNWTVGRFRKLSLVCPRLSSGPSQG